MSTREDLARLSAQSFDLEAVGLMELGEEQEAYFCTPVNARPLARLGCDGVHFVLLPEDERVFCVEPSMGEPGTYVLPVAADLRRFLSYVLFCGDANPLSQIFWMDEGQFRALLEEDQQAQWPGSGELRARKGRVLDALTQAFGLESADPFEAVKTLQREFDPASLRFSDEYYDTLGLERE